MPTPAPRDVQDALSRAHGLSDAKQRREFLDELRATQPDVYQEVASLLEVHPTTEGGGAKAADPGSPGFPELPGYRVVRVLDSGGFGTVYEAVPENPALKPVAVKVLQPGKRSDAVTARFHQERELHAQMDHPFVARVIDTGTTGDGQPFLVTELVPDSLTIIEYADRQRLTIPARIELFQRVCEGVHHLHLQGTIHRDLKPANILVSVADQQAQPKIIDFGIARSTEPGIELTQEGALLGTRGYMSPEQAAAQPVDLRTDIYSLGNVLYRLLVGILPPNENHEDPTRLETALDKVPNLDAVVEDRALTRPSQLIRQLRGDLETIVAKALRHRPEDRYQGAEQLQADLGRLLACEPVLARETSGLYRLRKLVRKHKVTAAAAAIAVAALGTGFGVAAVGLSKERAAKAALLTTNRDLQTFIDYERTRLRSIKPADVQAKLRTSVTDQLQKAVRASEEDATTHSRQLAEIETYLDHINFTSVAMDTLRGTVFRDAEAGIREIFGGNPAFEATMLHELAKSLKDVGLFKEAVSPAKAALETRRRLHGEAHASTIEALQTMGGVAMRTGSYKEALKHTTTAVDACVALHGETHPNTLASRLSLANTQTLLRRHQQALDILRPAAEAYQALGDDRGMMLARTNMATALLHLGKLKEAEPLLRETDEWFTAHLGPEDQQTLMTRTNLAIVLSPLGGFEEGADLAKNSYLGLRSTLGDEHPKTLTAANVYGSYLLEGGQIADAVKLYRETVRLRERVLGRHHQRTLVSMINLVRCLCNTRDVTAALAAGERLVQRARTALADSHPLIGAALVYRGRALFRNEKYLQAEAGFLDGYQRILTAYGPQFTQTQDAAACLMEVNMVLHKIEPSPAREKAIADWKAKAGGVKAELDPSHLKLTAEPENKK